MAAVFALQRSQSKELVPCVGERKGGGAGGGEEG